MSIKLQQERDSEAVAKHAVLFYETSGRQAFATEHEVKRGQIMPGRAINLRRFIHHLSRHDTAKEIEFIHPRCLVQQPGLLVWYRPAGYTRLLFTGHGARDVSLPALIFIVRENRMYVWAYSKKEDRPGPATKLYHPPIMNRYEKGDLCMGTMPKGSGIDTWEDSFFRSRFTHPHFSPPSYTKRKLFLNGTTAVKELTPAGQTLGQFLNSLGK